MNRILFRVALATLGATFAAPLHAQARPATKPTLIVYFTIDQMRSDYVDRWQKQLTGGLKRLGHQGAFFTNAFQDHGVTETAPGHSVTLSGRFPRSTGIVRNNAGVEDAQAPLLTSKDPAASPYRFRGTVLMDWLRTNDARSRGLSISRKDRGAILPMGRAHQSVFWYATSNGEFTTSRYYADTLATWIRRINARRYPQKMAGATWNLLLPASEYAEADSVPMEANGRDFMFPHVINADTARAATDLPATPYMDEFTLAAALEGLQSLSLGTGQATDLLAISLSATDYVGHKYGPDSREQHDNILRLDRSMGAFIDSLYKIRDSATIVFALGADHGVTSLPEVVAARKGGRPAVRYDTRPALNGLRDVLRAAKVDSTAVTLDGPLVYVNRAKFDVAGADADKILANFAAALRKVPGMSRVDRVKDLASRDTVHDAVSRRWYHMIPPDSPIEYVYTPVEFAYPVNATIAEHGVPYDDDAHVPVLFYGPWIKPGRYNQPALMADIAPTLAAIAGVKPTERLDGHARTEALVNIPKQY